MNNNVAGTAATANRRLLQKQKKLKGGGASKVADQALAAAVADQPNTN